MFRLPTFLCCSFGELLCKTCHSYFTPWWILFLSTTLIAFIYTQYTTIFCSPSWQNENVWWCYCMGSTLRMDGSGSQNMCSKVKIYWFKPQIFRTMSFWGYLLEHFKMSAANESEINILFWSFTAVFVAVCAPVYLC